jgi:hypothetical protein
MKSITEHHTNSQAPPPDVLHVSVSPYWFNKENRAPLRKNKRTGQYTRDYAEAKFFTKLWTPAKIRAQLIERGGAISVGIYRKEWRKQDNLISAQIMGVDSDGGAGAPDYDELAMFDELAQYAFLSYRTPSWQPDDHRARLLFILDQPITDLETYRRLLKRLLYHYSKRLPHVDASCKDAARRFYGSYGAAHTFRPDARLPIAYLESLPIHPDELPKPKYEYIPYTGADADQKAQEQIDRAIAEALATPAGAGLRHEAYNVLCMKLVSMHKGGYPGLSNVEALLEQLGRQMERDEREARDSIKGAFQKAEPRTLGVPKCVKPAQNHPKPSQNGTVSTPKHAGIKRKSAEIAPYVTRLWQYGVINLISTDAALIAYYMQTRPRWTIADLALRANIPYKTAWRWTNAALTVGLVNECRFPDFRTIVEEDSIVLKSGKRKANEARVFTLTLDFKRIADLLPDYVQELFDTGDPNVILKSEAMDAGLDPNAAERIELATRAISESIDAYEVRAKTERAALRKARELINLAETDETPFTPSTDPQTAVEMRAALVQALIATKPDKEWLQGDLRWIAGVKKKSVSYLITKAGLVPAAKPTFIDAPIAGKNLHNAVKAHQRHYRGSPVAWLAANGEVISSFSHQIPKGAAGVRLNVGKKYYPAAAAPAADPLPPTLQPEKKPAPEPTPAEKAARAVKQAQAYLKPVLAGNMRALNYTLTPGAYGDWVKEGQTVENTFDAMIAVMLREGERLSPIGDTPDCARIAHIEPPPVLPVGNTVIDFNRAKQPATAESIEAARALGQRLIESAARARIA